jgi:tellurium resistance protein TerZ
MHTQSSPGADIEPEPKEIVMGLHWDPPEEGAQTDPDDLDALCVLFDGQQRVLEVIHPGYPRNANESVIHTGDSRTGAGEWDDERIFVFLEALPKAVTALSFIVSSVKGRPLSDVLGASCHVSDHESEYRWIQLELSTLKECVAHCIGTVKRSPTGWNISTGSQIVPRELLDEVLSLVKKSKI